MNNILVFIRIRRSFTTITVFCPFIYILYSNRFSSKFIHFKILFRSILFFIYRSSSQIHTNKKKTLKIILPSNDCPPWIYHAHIHKNLHQSTTNIHTKHNTTYRDDVISGAKHTLSWPCLTSSMSNNPNDYEYIKALVRGLHIQKNVARPQETALLSPQLRNDEPDTTSNTDDDDDDDDDERTRLPTVDEAGASRASDLRLSKNELTRLRKQHKQTLRLNRKSLPQTHQPIHHRSNHSLNIPSVVVTGANDPTDLLTTTQRRFSQLYLGLRRFSMSHTVCCPTTYSTHQHLMHRRDPKYMEMNTHLITLTSLNTIFCLFVFVLFVVFGFWFVVHTI